MKNNHNIKLKTYDDIFNVIENLPENDINMIDINMLVDFRDHPFKVTENKDMEELFESILLNGILVPILVRPLGDRYEIISGHRRKYCAFKAGLKKVPCLVKEMSYDDAVFAMIDSNIQRKNILPSEKAYSYKMKLSAVKRQGERTDLTSRQPVDKSENLTSRQLVDKSADLIGKDYNDSGRNVQRYIRLTELSHFLIEAVDKKKLAFGAAVDLSYLSKEEQEMVEEVIKEFGRYPTIGQAKTLRDKTRSAGLTLEQMKIILIGKDDIQSKANVAASKNKQYDSLDIERFKKYFPEEYSVKDIEDEIISLLEKRK